MNDINYTEIKLVLEFNMSVIGKNQKRHLISYRVALTW